MGQADDELPLDIASTIAAARCRTLWIAVLLLAMQDADRGDARARAWLWSTSCAWICSAAGVEVGLVRRYEASRLLDGRRRLSAKLVMRRNAR